MKTASLPVLSFIFIGLFSAHAADWPRYRGPHLNGISKEAGLPTTFPGGAPKVLWKAKVGVGFSSIAVANGRAYTTGNADKITDNIFCFDAATGKEVWKHSYPAPLDPKYYEGGTSATPTVDGEHIYTFSKRGVVHCLDAAKGTVVWSRDLMQEMNLTMPEWGFASSALIEGNVLYLNAGGAGLALDKRTGKEIWKSDTSAAGYSTPEPYGEGGKRALVVFGGKDAIGVNAATGAELWRFPWKTRYAVNAAQPIVSGDKVFLSSGYDFGSGVIQLDGTSPKQIWKNKNLRTHMNSAVLWKGFLYGVDENQLQCVDFTTGEAKWADKSSGKGSLMMADGKLIVLSERGEMLIAEASPGSFKPMTRFQAIGGKCWTVPVLANGKIYCRNSAGDVVCLDVSGK